MDYFEEDSLPLEELSHTHGGIDGENSNYFLLIFIL